MVLAGVDIGTLTCRLLIAQVLPDGRLQEIESDRRILRLGEGLHVTGTLSAPAMVRVLDTLREWRARIEAAHVEAEAVVATSAVREARNRQDLVARAKELGYAIEVISGEEEARRTMLGIRSGLPAGLTRVLGLDLGGGSTEFMLDVPGRGPHLISVPLGVIRLREHHLHHDPPTAQEVAAAGTAVRKAVEAVRPKLGDLADVTLVGSGGTITTLAAMALRLPAYVPARIHNHRLDLETIRTLKQQVLSRRSTDLVGMPGLEAGREHLIVAGTLILEGAMAACGFTACLVSDLGLREGIVLDLASRTRRQPRI
jgi:exopolyphosphatase/guanosine-5'-triphosphate,3'-diphosphate pyrophosphatase